MVKRLVFGPSVEPVSLAEAKTHLRVEITEDDSLISALIVAARQLAEEFTRRAFLYQTWEIKSDDFPEDGGDFEFPNPPLNPSGISVQYVDAVLGPSTFDPSNYAVEAPNYPTAGKGRLRLVAGASWPTTDGSANAIAWNFQAGYGGTAAAVPGPIKAAILLIVGHLYANRESVVVGTIATKIPMAAEFLLGPYRVFEFV